MPSSKGFGLDLNNLTKNALLALGVVCAMMAALIVFAALVPMPSHFQVLIRLISSG
jgi:hypothetical protein